MQVREILRVKGSTLFTATPQQPLADAIAAMAEHDVGSLVVMGGGKMVGMLTFRVLRRPVTPQLGVGLDDGVSSQ